MTGPPVLVLAAGAGRRFGGDKLSAMVAGRPLLGWTLFLLGADVSAYVVVAPGSPCQAMAESGGAAVVVAANAEMGMTHSLAAGLIALPGEAPGAIVVLGDDPLAALALVAVATAATANPERCAAVRRTGPVPHPVYLPRAVWPSLAASHPVRADRGLRHLLDGNTIWIDGTEFATPIDVDTPDAMHNLESILTAVSVQSRAISRKLGRRKR